MTHSINHHIPAEILDSYQSGGLSPIFEVVIAAHISLCADCRAHIEANSALAGALIEVSAPSPIRANLFASILDEISKDAPIRPVPTDTIYSHAVKKLFKNSEPKWSFIGPGVHQSILMKDKNESVRLLKVAAGKPVSMHTHKGVEYTLVLQGSFSDEIDQFKRGDVEVADQNIEHQPIADVGLDCICLAYTSDNLKFSSIAPELLRPFIGM